MEDSCDLLPVIFTDSVFLPQLIWFWFRIYFEDRAVWKKAQLELALFLYTLLLCSQANFLAFLTSFCVPHTFCVPFCVPCIHSE